MRHHLSKFSYQTWLIIILVAGVLLRLIPAFLFGDSVDALPGIFDQVSYNLLANRLLEGHGFTFPTEWWPITKPGAPTAHWSYLYTFFLSGVYTLFGPHPLFARVIQAVVTGILTPWLTFRVSIRTFKFLGSETTSRVSLLAAAWVAIYPYFLYYSAALMTETFFIVAVLWILDIGQRVIEKDDFNQQSIRQGVELGVAIGVAALLRQLILLFIPFLFLFLLWASSRNKKAAVSLRSTLLYGLISIFTAGLLIAPFSAFNYSQFKRFVLLNTNAGYAFFWGNHPIYGDRFVPILTEDMPSYQELIPEELRSLDEAALDQALLQRGIGFVLSDPVRYIRLSLSRIPAYFMFWPAASSGLVSNLTRVLSFGLALPFMLLGTVLWIINVRKKKLDPAPGALLLLFAFTFSAIHLLSWALIRYRLPVDAVMLVFAAYGLYFALSRVFTDTLPQNA